MAQIIRSTLFLALLFYFSLTYSTSQRGFLQLQIRISSRGYQISQIQKNLDIKAKSFLGIINNFSYQSSDCQYYSRVTHSETNQYSKSKITNQTYKIAEQHIVYQICTLDSLLFVLKQMRLKGINHFRKLSWKKDTKRGIQQVQFLPFGMSSFEQNLINRVIQFLNNTINQRNQRINLISKEKADQSLYMLITYHQMAIKKQLQKFIVDLKQKLEALENHDYDSYQQKKLFLGKSNGNHLYMSQNITSIKFIQNQNLTLDSLLITYRTNTSQLANLSTLNKQISFWVEATFVQQKNGSKIESQRFFLFSNLDFSVNQSAYYRHFTEQKISGLTQVNIYLRSIEGSSIYCQGARISLFYR